MNSSRLLKGLSSCREVVGLALRPDKVLMDQLLEGNMALGPDREIMSTEAMALGTLVEDQLKSLELLHRIIGLFQTT